ncbi:hypothetical protein SAY87_000735 [Trapa incisa]|uniref:Dof zinc finger protein n=1 Tax=Trapa incisa TaxID=236973 RepID=A0AAN7JGE9_9MYRT|nr:hypothetical protein SAY87_000735 [Trapa incisa]
MRRTDSTLRCPPCDSSNTKFCYYNNYRLSQPRHFCKTCRRYWTKGGALRNVPIGSGCRKNKKLKSSSSRLSAAFDSSSPSPFVGVVSPPSSTTIPGFRLFQPAFHWLWTSRSTHFPHSTAFPCPHTRHHHLPKPPLASSGTTIILILLFSFRCLCRFTIQQLRRYHGRPVIGIWLNEHSEQPRFVDRIPELLETRPALHWKLQQQRLAMLLETSPCDGISIESQKNATAGAAATTFGSAETPPSLSLENRHVLHRPQPVNESMVRSCHRFVPLGGRSRFSRPSLILTPLRYS